MMEERRRRFVHPERKTEASVNIRNEKAIGEGHFGKAFRSVVEVRHGDRAKEMVMVRKEYKALAGKDPKQFVQRAVENYKRLKDAGCRVFTTFRAEEDGSSILMTDGGRGDVLCVGSNEGSSRLAELEDQERTTKLEDIPNLQQLLQDMYADAIRAAEQGLTIDPDMFFFLVQRDFSSVDYVFGDVDMVVEDRVHNVDERKEHNMSAVFEAIVFFIENNLADDRQMESVQLARRLYQEQGNLSGEPVPFSGVETVKKKK